MSTYYRPTNAIPLQAIKDSKFLQDHEFYVVEDFFIDDGLMTEEEFKQEVSNVR